MLSFFSARSFPEQEPIANTEQEPNANTEQEPNKVFSERSGRINQNKVHVPQVYEDVSYQVPNMIYQCHISRSGR